MGWPFAIHDAPPISKVMPFDGALYTEHNLPPVQGHANRLSGMVLGFRCSDKVNDTYPMQWDVFVGKPLSNSNSFTTASHNGRFYLWAEF
jgi:hemolysin activation/secretion protein